MSFEDAVKTYSKEKYTGDIDTATRIGLSILSEAIVGGK